MKLQRLTLTLLVIWKTPIATKVDSVSVSVSVRFSVRVRVRVWKTPIATFMCNACTRMYMCNVSMRMCMVYIVKHYNGSTRTK